MIKKLIYGTAVLVLLAGCTTTPIDKWNNKGCAWFTDDITEFTFMNYPDVEMGGTALAAIPLSFATTIEDRDRTVNVQVSKNPSNSSTTFEVQNPVVLHANCSVDTMWVKVTLTENLTSQTDTIGFRISSSDDFYAGLSDKLETRLCVSNTYPQPDWWDANAVDCIGYFTQLKMQVFLAVMGNGDDPRGGSEKWYSNIAITYMMQKLSDYIDENNIRYPANDPHSPGNKPRFYWNAY